MARKPGDKGGDDLFDKLFGEEEEGAGGAGRRNDIDLDQLDREVGLDDEPDLGDEDVIDDEQIVDESHEVDEFEEASDDDFIYAEEADIQMVNGEAGDEDDDGFEETDPQALRSGSEHEDELVDDGDGIRDDLLGDEFDDSDMDALAEGRLDDDVEDDGLGIGMDDGLDEEADEEEIFGNVDSPPPSRPMFSEPDPMVAEPAVEQMFAEPDPGMPHRPTVQEQPMIGESHTSPVERPPTVEDEPLFGAPDPDAMAPVASRPAVEDDLLFGAPDPDPVAAVPAPGSGGLSGNTEGYDGFDEPVGGRGVAPVRGGGAMPAAKPGPPQPLADEATQIIDIRDARPKTEVPRLVVHTRDRGDIEYRIEEDGLTIGRGVDNDVVISDIAASRQHAIIQVRDGRYFLADLGSGNGTRVAGRKVTEVPLKGGEQVEIGMVRCHFVVPSKGGGTVPGVSTARTEGTSRLGKILLVVSLLLLLAVIAGVVVKYVLPKGTVGGAKVGGAGAGGVAAVAEAAGGEGTAKKFFDQGVGKFKQRAWKDALNKFQVVAQLNAEFPNIDSYVKRCREEEENERHHKEGQAALRERRFDEARRAFQQVSMESVYRTDSQQALMRVEDALVSEYMRKAKEVIKRDPQQAFDLAKEALAISQTNTTAFELKNRAEEALGGGGRVAAAPDDEPRPTRRRTKRPRRRTRRSTPRERSAKPEPEPDFEEPEEAPAPAGGAISDGLALFDNKKFAESARFFERLISSGKGKRTRKQAAGLARKVKTFKASWDSGTNHLKKRAFQPAIREFENALKAGKGINSRSPVLSEIKQRRLAPAYVLYGNDALKNTKYREAYSAFKKALKHKSDYQPAKKGLSKLGGQAKKLYYEGYVAKYSDPDTAKKKWRIVVQITPPDNEWHQKAKKRLEE